MEDDDLAAIRARRMAELRGGAGSAGASGPGGFPAGLSAGGNGPSEKEQADQQSEMEERRRTMLSALLDSEARERLSRISIVKSEKARAVEDLLIRMAQAGQLRGKISEKMLIDLLEQLNEQQKAEPKVTITRRRFDDSDDEDLLSGL